MPEEHVITDIRRSPRGARLEVYVDGERAWQLTRKYLDKLGLAVGQRLSSDALTTLRQTIALHETRDAALRALGQRARTRADLGQRLTTRGYPDWAVTATLDWLAERGLLDDAQYAQDRVVSLRQRRLGSRAIELKLQQEGVPQDLIREVMAQRAEELHETELARKTAEQLNARWGAQEWPRRRARIYQYLARRGFDGETIADALERLEPGDESSEVM